LIATVARELSACRARRADIAITHLIPASGDQDHTTSPSDLACARLAQPVRPSHPAPTLVTIAQRPSYRARDTHKQPWFSEKQKLNIFDPRAGQAKSA
jgi:hypothetical protein